MTSSKANILFVQHTSEVGGSLVSLYQVLRGLKKYYPQWELTLLCKHQKVKEWYEPKCQELGISTLHLKAIGFFGHCSGCTYDLKNPRHLLSLCKQLVLLPWYVYSQYRVFSAHPATIIHLNSSVLLSSAIAAKIANKKVVWHIREVLSLGHWGLRKKIFSGLINKFSDQIIAISPFEAENLENIPIKKIAILYNSIDFSQYSPWVDIDKSNLSSLLKKFGIVPPTKVILSLGGLSPIKGGLELIQSFSSLPPETHLLIAGAGINGGDYADQVLQLIDSKPEQEKIRIHLVGDRHAVPELLAACDVLYFGGTIPHFPRPIYEAWALKKPVVAFQLPGIQDNIDSMEDGLLCPKISGEELAKTFNLLFQRSDLGRSLGEKGFTKTRERFDLEKNIFLLTKIYDKFPQALTKN